MKNLEDTGKAIYGSNLDEITRMCDINISKEQEGPFTAMMAEELLRATTAEAAYIARQESIIEIA